MNILGDIIPNPFKKKKKWANLQIHLDEDASIIGVTENNTPGEATAETQEFIDKNILKGGNSV